MKNSDLVFNLEKSLKFLDNADYVGAKTQLSALILQLQTESITFGNSTQKE